MAEATIEPGAADEAVALQEAARAIEHARIRQIGSQHIAMAMGALTLWGAAEAWAQTTGWGLAHFAALVNAVVAGFVIPSVVHEWGHFAGARLAGAESPVFDAPRRHFFLFDFPMDRNDTTQFLWMSWGGILAPWAVVVLAALLVPLSLTSGALLFATLVGRAVATAAFEVPVVLRTRDSGDPGAELGRQARSGGLPRSQKVGAVVGAACFALLWIA
jgi:hypothetical protein